MHGFKIGDRVRVTDPAYAGTRWDCDATVSHFSGPFVAIKTDTDDLGGFYPENLTLVPAPQEPKVEEVVVSASDLYNAAVRDLYHRVQAGTLDAVSLLRLVGC